jgi:probable rRNA maturation factor
MPYNLIYSETEMIRLNFDDDNISCGADGVVKTARDGGLPRLAERAARILQQSEDVCAFVGFRDADGMRALNADARGVDKATDVLSFPLLSGHTAGAAVTRAAYPNEFDAFENAVFIGDVIVCPSVAAAQAAEYGWSAEYEIGRLFVHGLLHLYGFDHETDEQFGVMRAVENEILQD